MGYRKPLKANKLRCKVLKNKHLAPDLGGLHRFRGSVVQMVVRCTKKAGGPK
jgi:hypothetical protein